VKKRNIFDIGSEEEDENENKKPEDEIIKKPELNKLK
jgi:hypothetical protein